jgi:tetratricopeptide (TPR) repeat protein
MVRANGESSYPLCTVALVYALGGQTSDAERVLAEVDQIESVNALESECWEARLVCSISRKDSPEAGAQYANKAILLSPSALVANRYLGHAALRAKSHNEAIGYFRKALECFPDHEGTLFDTARALIEARRRVEAHEYIRRTPTSLRKLAYRMIAAFFGAGRFLIGLAIGLPIMLLPTPWPPFLLSALVFAVGVGLGLRKRDTLVVSAVAIWQMEAVVFLGLRFLSRAIFAPLGEP